MTTTPTLVIAAGSAVTTWECLNGTQPLTFYPQEDMGISDIAWNHNGQGIAAVLNWNGYRVVICSELTACFLPTSSTRFVFVRQHR